jgi:predicted metalloprotease
MGGIPMGGKIGIPGLILLVAVIVLSNSLGGGDEVAPSADPQGDEKLKDFMEFVLDDVQGFWADTFRQNGKPYREATLVLFEGRTDSDCGGASSDIGPHYCPADQNVYLDLGFFRELKARFGAPGDFAQAYVLAHEVGHHVQNLLGTMERVERLSRSEPGRENDLSIRLELQADCYAGAWGFTTYDRDILDSGDLEEGLKAAAAVGDDRIQKQSTGRVNPETWTHGSSEQRVRWFKRGFADGDPNDCDTFSAESL